MEARLGLVYKLDSEDPAFLDSFYPLRRIREACRSRGIALELFLAGHSDAEFAAFAERSRGGRVWLRGELPEGLLARLDESGLDCFNAAAAVARVRDKAWLDAFLASRGSPRPRRLDPSDRGELARSLPFIAKPRRGMMGRGVRLIEDGTAMERLLSEPLDELVLQEYVAQSRGRDFRAFVCRGRPLAVMRRESEGLVSNVHGGGRASAAELDSRWLELAAALLRDAGLEYGAVDFLERGPGDLLVCEINAVPGFEALERATGADVAGSILDLCIGA